MQIVNFYDLDIETPLSWEHCENINIARKRYSQLTNLLNKVIAVQHDAKKELLLKFSEYPSAILEKMSFDNKLVALLTITQRSPETVGMVKIYFDSTKATTQLKNKQKALLEDLLGLKKILDVTPR